MIAHYLYTAGLLTASGIVLDIVTLGTLGVGLVLAAIVVSAECDRPGLWIMMGAASMGLGAAVLGAVYLVWPQLIGWVLWWA